MKKYLEDSTTTKLEQSALWQEKISEDCRKQNVFFTIWENRIDLYHKGGKTI